MPADPDDVGAAGDLDVDAGGGTERPAGLDERPPAARFTSTTALPGRSVVFK